MRILTPATAQRFVTNNAITWTQCVIGKDPELMLRYRLRRAASVLIGPDGLILQSDLRGSAITDALAEALGAK
jgi:hypothetical protein